VKNGLSFEGGWNDCFGKKGNGFGTPNGLGRQIQSALGRQTKERVGGDRVQKKKNQRHLVRGVSARRPRTRRADLEMGHGQQTTYKRVREGGAGSLKQEGGGRKTRQLHEKKKKKKKPEPSWGERNLPWPAAKKKNLLKKTGAGEWSGQTQLSDQRPPRAKYAL